MNVLAARPARLRALASFLAVAAAWLPASRTASAADVEVTSDTVFQAYEVTDPWGANVIERRRLMQTLGLGVYNLQGKQVPGKADYRIVMRMRLDADFGINSHLQGGDAGGETSFHTVSGDGVRYVPGLQQAPIDLMYGYIEGRNLANGLLGFRVGRQYMTDMLGWWSFDGGLVRVTTPYYVQFEGYGGFEQRGGLPLSSSRFEQQGIWRGSHSDFGSGNGQPNTADYPSYQYAEPAPAFGFALETNGPSFVHGRFSYRRVYNTGQSLTQQFPDPAPGSTVASGGYKTISGTRLSSDKLGYAADINKNDLGALKGGFSYDLYNQLVATYFGGVEAYIGKHLILGADIDYFVPTFDADSIWNWFTHSPVTTITGRTSIKFSKRFDMSASGGVRLWTADGDPATFGQKQCEAAGQSAECYRTFFIDPGSSAEEAVKAASHDEANRELSTTLDGLGNLALRYRFPTALIGLRGMVELGERGHRGGGELSAEKKLDDGRWAVGSRVSVYDWADPTRPDRDATSFAYVLAGGFKPTSVADFRVEWEHEMNRLVGQRFRVVGLVNILVQR